MEPATQVTVTTVVKKSIAFIRYV